MPQGNYGDDSIEFISVTEHLRKRPSMWGFNVSSIEGLLIQCKEIADNSFDEARDRNKIYPVDITFFVAKDKSTYQCLVRDHGRGIPVGTIDKIFVGGFSSGKYRGDDATTGTNGIGSKAVSVFSKTFLAFTKRQDGFGYVKIEKGDVKDSLIKRKPLDKDESTSGTTVLFQPDPEIMVCVADMFGPAKNGLEKNGFDTFVERTSCAPIFRPNILLTIRTVDRLLKPAELNQPPEDLWRFLTNLDQFKSTVIYQSDTNLKPRQYVQQKFHLKEPIWEIGELHKEVTPNDEDRLGYDIDVFLDDRTLKGDGGYAGGVNATPINSPDSSHMVVLQEVLKSHIANNVDEDADKEMFFENKYRIPLSGVVSVFWKGASFEGQSKNGFMDRTFEQCFRINLRKELKKLTEAKGDGIWDRLWEIIHDNFEQEYSRFSSRSFKTGGDIKNLSFDLKRSDSFHNCELKNSELVKTELFITEGDSAAGRVKSERNSKFQAVLKLAGKPKNAIRDDGPKLKENAVYSDLCRILGVNRSDTDLKNMRFDKILLLTDADADGYHIVALMIGMFMKINPLILEEGRVCVTNPPLYSIVNGNSVVYLRDVEALEEARRSAYRTLFDIDVVVQGGARFHVNKDISQFRDICLIVNEIGEVVEHKADLLNIDPLVLEQLIHCVDYLDEKHVDVEAIKKKLTATDVMWDKANNVIVMVYEVGEHSLEYRIPLARLQKIIAEEILPIYERFHWRDIDLYITTRYSDVFKEEPCTFMMLYDIFKRVADSSHGILKARRFKGLGEMSKEDITQTCINPQTRSFTTVRSIGDAKRIYELLGVDTNERKKLINSGLMQEG